MHTNSKPNQRNLPASLLRVAVLCGLLHISLPGAIAQTAGALANGLSAQAVSRGGTLAAETEDPIDAIQGNPAGMAGIRTRVLDVSGAGMIASGSFTNSVDPNGKLSGGAGALPSIALGIPLGRSRWIAALAATPDALMKVNWQYTDPPGTAGVTYGLQTNESQILALRSAAALAGTLGRKFSVGATVGLDYNTNILKAPYIFQQQPQLAGLKVLLNLYTAGVGWNGSAGAQWQPSSKLRVGAAWKSTTFIQSFGTASGTASALFTAIGVSANPVFQYRAEVDNQLPQTAALGASWQATARTRIGVETDWTNWGAAFRVLPVKLTDGTNAVVNSVVGSTSLNDGVPLHWSDQYVVRFGAERTLVRGWAWRGGYSYMTNPVPSTTLTPMTAAILRNSLATGIGWSREALQWNLAYQAQLPASQSVSQSGLQAGEYDNSKVSLMAQSLTLSARFTF